MNKVEVINFEVANIEIKSKTINKIINDELKQFLLYHTGITWNIKVTNDDIFSLKDVLTRDAGKTPIWNKVVKKFPAAKITDILLKK